MRRRSLAVSLAALALCCAASGGAYAYFASTGSATASVIVGNAQTVTISTAGTPSAPLLPGGPAGDLVFSVTNPNSYPVSLVSVVSESGGTISFDGAHASCSTTDANPVVTLSVPGADLPVSIPANSTTPIDLAASVSMDAAATNSCQGATISIPITITVNSA
jgi:hypothetical protein